MVRTYVVHQELIKRSGITAASFLIATLAMVIMTAGNASALLGVELPLGKNLAPVTDRVNGLVNKSLDLPITVDSTDRLKVNLLEVADIKAEIPIVPTVVDGVTEPLDSTVEGVSHTLRPVTDNTVPAVRSAFSRSLGGNNSSSQPPSVAPSSENTDGTDVAGVSDVAITPQPEPDTKSTPKQTTFFGGITSFFASTLPATLQDIARNIAGKEVSMAPIIISILLFLMTIGAIGGIVHASNRGGVLSLGRYKFTLFAKGTDLTEMATFIVVAISFGVIAIFLVLTSL